jgi:meso-butanediol dehydrogenase/(S,S)-butanediol dehydrogenase/diacetyl reductase
VERFAGRVALVTAAAQGIGRAVAHRIAAEGGSVVITDVNVAGAEVVAAEIGDRALALRVDVTVRSEIEAAVAAAVEKFGGLDVLVNNAGANVVRSEPEETSAEEWHRQLDVTLVSAMQCIQAALPELVARRGSVVTIGSINSLTGIGNLEYAAAKAGQQSLTQNLAVRYGAQGVRFNLVAPGTVRTPNWDDQPGQLDQLARLYPLRRVGEPEDIAAAVAFLASDDAAWITGHTLPVEGGLLAGPPLRNLDD